MKTTIATLLVVAFVAASYSAPSAVRSQKWTEFSAKIYDIKALSHQTGSTIGDITPKADWLYITVLFLILENFTNIMANSIKEVTENVDESLKNAIHSKVDAVINQTEPIFDIGWDLVDGHVVTRKNASDLFDNQLQETITNLTKNLQPELDQLSDDLASIIRNIIAITKTDLTLKTQMMHFALDIVWIDVHDGAENVYNYLISKLEQIRTIANSDNEEVGASIGEAVDNVAESLTYYFDTITSLISQGSFTERETGWYLRHLQDHILQLPRNIKDDLLKLNVSASGQIIEIIKSGLDGLDKKGVELTKLLSEGDI